MGRQVTTLTIRAGNTESEELSIRAVREASIQAPDTLSGNIVVQSGSQDADGGRFTTVQSPPGTDIVVAAGKTTVLTAMPFPRIRLQSDAAGGEASDAVFVVTLVVGE